ncbi:MAG: aspartyl protease family protein [Reichenbachiella sp.]
MTRSIKYSFCIIALLISCKVQWTEALKKGAVQNNSFEEAIEVQVLNDLIIIPVTIEGTQYRFLFDTGAPFSISTQIQNQMSYKKISSSQIKDTDENKSQVDYVTVSTLELGKIAFYNQTAFVANFESNPILKCMKLDGIIGSNLIRHCNWKIDFGNKEITISDLSHSNDSPNFSNIPFHYDQQYNMMVDLNVGRAKIKNLTIDYGFNRSLSLPTNVFSTLKDKEIIKKTFFEVGTSRSGIIGKPRAINREMGILDTIKLSDVHHFNTLAKAEGSGLIGTGILSKHLIFIDWKNHTIQIDSKHPSPSNPSSFGFKMGISRENEFYLQSIIEGSPAYNAGLSPNLKVVSVDSLDLITSSFCDYMNFAKQNPDKLSLVIENENGNQKTYMLEKAPYSSFK